MTTANTDYPKQKIPALKLLAIGLALGLSGDLLMEEIFIPGPGFTLWTALFGLTAIRIGIVAYHPHLRSIMTWSGIASLAALMLVFRISPPVIISMWLVMLLCTAMILMELRGISLLTSTVNDHLRALGRVPVQALAGTATLLMKTGVSDSTVHSRILHVFRGIFIALPLLALFSILFSQADDGFASLLEKLLDVFSPELPAHLAVVFILTWVTTGMLAAINPEHSSPAASTSMSGFKLGTVETVIVMGTLNLLFITFVVFQLPYLFGGSSIIDTVVDLSMARYARQGFFELVSAASLTLGILLVLEKSVVSTRLFRPLAIVLLVCVFIILCSALLRLYIYTYNYGLTLSRLSALTLIAWIAICLVLFTAIILRGKTKGFAMGMLISAMMIAFTFSASNPSAVVARINTSERLLNSRSVDVNYLLRLGADSTPFLIEKLDFFDTSDRCMLVERWLFSGRQSGIPQSGRHGTNDWRTWNLIRHQAWTVIIENEEKLLRIHETQCR